MNRILLLAALILIVSGVDNNALAADSPANRTALSPDKHLQVAFALDERGTPRITVAHDNEPVASVTAGLELLNEHPLDTGFTIIGTHSTAHDQTYEIPVGKASQARDHYSELVVSLAERSASPRRLDLAFRMFNDGFAFQYRLPEQPSLANFTITAEHTELTFPLDSEARFLPLNSYTTSYEKRYDSKRLSQLPPDTLLGLPLLLKQTSDGQPTRWIAVTEAGLTDYAGLYLAPVKSKPHSLTARLSPLPARDDAAKVVGKTPFASPWRILMIGESIGKLLESNMVFHLNRPCAIADTSWIKPGKTTFPWWNGYVLTGVDFQPGLNTLTHKHYIDFCAEQGIPYHSLDGTDTAWYGGPIVPTGPTDITRSVPEIDLPELLRYAQQKGVRLRLWMHWRALRPQIDEAFPLYEKWGIEGVMVDFMDRDDQEMVRFYHEVAEKAARRHLTVTWHGAYKPTGMERTWPNVLTYEAALNQEYDKWDPLGASPTHNLDIALVRMLAGPLDYHQGGMRNVLPRDFQPRDKSPAVQGTRAHQLGMYVVFENHLPMLVDFPAAYRGQPGLDFLAKVPTNWDQTLVPRAELRKCIVVARRSSSEWWLGGMAGDQQQTFELPLNFIGAGRFAAQIHRDDLNGPATALQTERQIVRSSDSLKIIMAAGGGFAAHITPIDN